MAASVQHGSISISPKKPIRDEDIRLHPFHGCEYRDDKHGYASVFSFCRFIVVLETEMATVSLGSFQ